QRVDHSRGRGLAVGTGDVDGREGPLRPAEQVEQGLDPGQVKDHPRVAARVELRLDPRVLRQAHAAASAGKSTSAVNIAASAGKSTSAVNIAASAGKSTSAVNIAASAGKSTSAVMR